MGRYYSFASGEFGGKFGLAIQPSDDPKIFGMKKVPPATISYFLENNERNVNKVKKSS